MAPLKLVDKALEEKLKQERKGNTYNRVWIVFDKDEFKDFNDAINRASLFVWHAVYEKGVFR